eukprot:TRINITY_DN50627_c0_g1_i1.p1 TRINITY_DN50627_c0_g1~~TRINITY_DN50627_c0_g1_i1.p1  ORF type:complete len:333 (-),score=37.05 TRINITY_DN50627_c0_g1_i1:120-1118(-)
MISFHCPWLSLCLCVALSSRCSGVVHSRRASSALRVADNGFEKLNFQQGFSKSGDAHCKPPGLLKFAHVMKSGGLAVDTYLGCRCEQEGCSVSHHEGVDGMIGDPRCTVPSVCTSHHAPFRMWEECSKYANFTRGRVFTVLRDPVERVLSFYNYMKYPRPGDRFPGYEPYQTRSLREVLLSWGVVDLNIGQPNTNEKGGCVICARQISNAMVLRHFATMASVAAQESWIKTGGILKPPTPAHMEYQLEQAKRTLSKMDAVFIGMKSFKEAFEKQDLLHPEGRPTSTTCNVPTVNPTGTKETPTPEELNLIRSLNWADIELYNFAKALPNARF